MWIICLADNSHEMSILIFFEKYEKWKKKSKYHLLQLWLAPLGLIIYGYSVWTSIYICVLTDDMLKYFHFFPKEYA